MGRRRGKVLAAALLLSACSSMVSDETEFNDPTSSDDPVTWVACGDIECGTFAIPVDHSTGEASGVMDLAVYRRRGAPGSPTLLLVGPRVRPFLGETKWGARSLARRAALVLGNAANDYDVVAVTLRGSHDMPMPSGAESFVGSLDIADDLELLRAEGLAVKSVHVVGWGDGATAVAAWVMKRPGSIRSAVIDSPVDPTRSLTEQETARLTANRIAAERAVRWCASHLTCPVNASPTDNIKLLQERMEQGSAPDGVSIQALARASDVALGAGRPNDLWRGISEATARRGDVLAGLAGPTLGAADVAHICRDVGATSPALAAAHDRERTRYFTVGARREALALCETTTGEPRQLGEISPVRAAKDARILVTAAAGDPLVPALMAKSMAERLTWKWRSAVLARHLVVGIDRATTDAAMKFLADD